MLPNSATLPVSLTNSALIFVPQSVSKEKKTDDSKIENLQKALNSDIGEERDAAFNDLVRLCCNDTVTDSVREHAKLLLLSFLAKTQPADIAISPLNDAADIDQLLVNALKNVWLLECEKLAPAKSEPVRGSLPNINYVPVCSFKNYKIFRLVEKLFPIYFYLRDKIDHLDDQLFEEALALSINGNVEAAWAVNEVLSRSDNKDIKIKAGYAQRQIQADIVSDISPLRPRSKSFVEWAAGAKLSEGLKSRLLLAQQYLSPTSAVKPRGILLLAEMMEKAPQQVRRIFNELVQNSSDLEVLKILSEIYGAGRFAELRGDDVFLASMKKLSVLEEEGCFGNLKCSVVAAKLKQKVRAREIWEAKNQDICGEEFHPIAKSQMEVLSNPYFRQTEGVAEWDATKDNNFLVKAVTVLESLSEKNDHSAVLVKEILTSWCSKTEDQILLMKQLGIEAARSSSGYDQYKNKFEAQVKILSQQVRTLQEQGKKEEAARLVYQLIEAEIDIELPYLLKGEWNPNAVKICQMFSQLLSDCDVMDNDWGHELVARLNALSTLGFNNVISGTEEIRRAYKTNVPGRPLANYQLGLYLFEAGKQRPQFLKEAVVHFQIAASSGYAPAKQQLAKITELIAGEFNEAWSYAKRHKERMYLGKKDYINKAIDLYKWAAEAGHVEARFIYLSLLISERNDVNAEYELGKLYLTGSDTANGVKAEFPKRNVLKAQKLFRSAAKKGHAKAITHLDKNGKLMFPVLSKDSAQNMMILANLAMRKHNERSVFDFGMTHLDEAIERYELVMKFYEQTNDALGSNIQIKHAYLECLAARGNDEKGDAKAQVELGKIRLDHFHLSEDAQRNTIALLEKATTSTNKEVKSEAHLILAQFYAKIISKILKYRQHYLFADVPGEVESELADMKRNAVKHYKYAVDLGNKDAGALEISFLKQYIVPNSKPRLNENSTVIVRLKEIAHNSKLITQR
ncbi:MAG: hypothetical protein K0R08_2265 [Solimicrobium sp.]|nr:hypothetical protein [Solimicrobium sp.]